MTTNETATVTCTRCAGAGTLAHLRHVEGGRCFQCEGTGRVTPSARPVRTYKADPDRVRLDLRAIYKNAQAGRVDYAECTDGEARTPAHFAAMLDEVPGSREAFRALGWPV